MPQGHRGKDDREILEKEKKSGEENVDSGIQV